MSRTLIFRTLIFQKYPLHLAYLKRDIETIELLHQKGVDSTIPNNEGLLAIHMLTKYNSETKIIEECLCAQYKVNSTQQIISKDKSNITKGVSHH